MGSPEEFASRLQNAGASSAAEYYNGGSPGFRPVVHQLGSIIGPLDSIGCMPVCPGTWAELCRTGSPGWMWCHGELQPE